MKNKKIVPKLRFPEFKKAESWENEPLLKYLEESKIKGHKGNEAKKLTVKLWGKGVHEKNERIEGSKNTQYYVRRAGQFIYSKLDFLNQAFDLIPEHLDKYESTVDLPCFNIHKNINPKFLLEYVKRKEFYKDLGEVADGGRKARRIQIDTFLSFPIIKPKLIEQEKIADCLTSIDDLITLHSQKLDELKNYKKGLMQQLFPAEGANIPTLRFPEFKNCKEWENLSLGELGENKDSQRIAITKNERVAGIIPYYGASGIIDYVNNYIFDEDILCISEDGANLQIRSFPIAFSVSGKSWINNHAHVLCFSNISTQVIVENYINAINLDSFLTGMAQPKLNRKKLDLIPIPLPQPTEQKKLAQILASINNIIKQQKFYLESLKEHKKALIQQLFPSLDEVL